MKITFDHSSTNQNVDRATTAYRNTQTPRTERTGDYALDISGTVMDNNAYGGHGKTAEEVMQDAGLVDLATQRDYMTVMSNTMSQEDFQRLGEDGYHPGDMEIEEVVTIVDSIKTALIKGGTQVEGYTDDLDAETLREITGSETFARELYKQFKAHDIPLTRENVTAARQAYDRAAQMQTPTEGTVKYMVENDMEPTIENLYRAGHSATPDSHRQGHGYYAADNTGYYAKKAEEYNWEQLRPQMEKVLEEAGLEITEENLQSAGWLVEAGVPLTKETMTRLYEIEQVKLPQEMPQILSAVAAAISDGKSAEKADLSDGRSNREKAADYVEAYGKISDEAVDQTVAEEKELNLRNLEKAQQMIEQNGVSENTPEAVSARRQLEEVRLMMTIEANRRLLESGYSIDTTDLEKLVEALKKMEEELNQKLFGETDAAQKAALYDEVQYKTQEIPYLPAAVLARFIGEEELFTLDGIHTSGTALKNAYEAARESYETLMTAPRADMGDSICKAFRNVDDILRDMGLEQNEENRRAIRILGYNSMDITQDNMDAVKKYDMELRQTIRRMTPAVSLQAIRDGRNPLTMSIAELNQYLDESGYAKEAKEEKFSKYLYKLEQNHAIDEQEREAYIGIYRMFRQLEKTDDAAVGSLIKEGAGLSFQNLLTAMRSTRRQGMDYTVDDEFNGVNAVNRGKSITDQILSAFSVSDQTGADSQAFSQGNGQPGRDGEEAYYHMLAGQIADTMEPEMLAQMDLRADMTMEEMAEGLEQMAADDRLEMAYLQEELQPFQDLQGMEEAVVRELLAYRQPVTGNNLAAATALRKKPGDLYKKLNDLETDKSSSKGKEAAAHFIESLTDKDSAQEAYEAMQDTFGEILEESKEESTSYLDLKTLQSCQKQLALAGSLAKEENYQIPVEINGELTAVNLKILHGGEGGKVSASISTQTYGQITAQFAVRNQTVSGYVACDSKEGTEKLWVIQDDLKQALAVETADGGTLKVGSVGFLYSAEANTEGYTPRDLETDENIQTADLYRIARVFITSVTA